jgi:hypothetical protein
MSFFTCYHHLPSAPPDLTAVQDLFASVHMDNHVVTSIDNASKLRDRKIAVQSGQSSAVAAIRSGRLIDLGEIDLTCLKSSEVGDAPFTFGNEPTAYTFVTVGSAESYRSRLLHVVAPRERLCSAFEVIPSQDGTSALWLWNVVDDEFIGAWPGVADEVWAAGCATALARLVSLSKIQHVPAPADKNRNRRARGLPPLPGYFKATPPPPPSPSVHAAGAGHHASPEPHLRRGHTRRLRDGRTIPVRPCRVRGGPAGVGSNFHGNRQEAV